MTYSIDLRERAVEYVRDGGSQTEACKLFKISRKTLYNWLQRSELGPQEGRAEYRSKLDKSALLAHVKEYPDAILRERAAHFGVHINAIWVALKRLVIIKKNDTVPGEKARMQDKFSA